MSSRITLTQFLNEDQRTIAGATGDFTGLINDIAIASKTIANAVGRGALLDGEPDLGTSLRALANDLMVEAFGATSHLAGVLSEDMDQVLLFGAEGHHGRYLLTFDPLNGHTELDINSQAGTIFSILRAPAASRPVAEADFLRPGTDLVCAGLVQYGASTRLVLATTLGVNGFTLDRELGEYALTHPHVAIPAACSGVALKAAGSRSFEPPVRRYLEECLAGREGPRGRDVETRWAASLVAETYRILTRGGVFVHPHDDTTRENGGHLDLLCEVNPVAWIVERAGGGAITGRNRILDLEPSALHQRVPLIFGSAPEIEILHTYHRDYADGRDSAQDDLPLFARRSLFR